MTQVRIDQRELKALLAGRDGAVWQDIQRRGNRVLNAAVRLCPTDEGRLRNSLTLEMRLEDGVPTARVGTNLKYGLYVHEGTGLYSKTRPGYIVPIRAKVLVWPKKNPKTGRKYRRYKGGKTKNYVVAKRSSGSPGRPFLRDALPAGLT